MFYRLAADILVVIHVLFILFVVLGGFLVLKWGWVKYLHIPCAIWGALIEFAGWICPLTPWEIELRWKGFQEGYKGGFISHYILPLVYPDELTRELQIFFGAIVVVINISIYGWIIYKYLKINNQQEK